MRAIKLTEIDRLARQRFGEDAADVIAGVSAAAYLGKLPDDAIARGLGSVLHALPAPPRDVPFVAVRNFSDAHIEVPAWLQQPDPIQQFYAALEDTRPDLFN